MPTYDVHLYTLYRVKFAGIKAADQVEAIRLAMQLRHEDAETVEDAEGQPLDALVDQVDDNGDRVEDGDIFDIIPNGRLAPRIIPARFRDSDAYAAALDLLKMMARMTIDGDIVDGEEYLAEGNDDEIDALYHLIHRARDILGFDDPAGIRTLEGAS